MGALKVVPMLRGIAFEFAAHDRLKELLPAQVWRVDKPIINAQSTIQDIDILVTHLPTSKQISIECKLAAKDSLKLSGQGRAQIRVKCMRSRTVGPRAAADLARRYRQQGQNVTKQAVLKHRDNYRDCDFNFVLTSVGNALWTTRKSDGMYVFEPKPRAINYCRQLLGKPNMEINEVKKGMADYLLVAPSSRLKVCPENNIECRRKTCRKARTSRSCGFIPNYPIADLIDHTVWVPIENAERVFAEFIRQRDAGSAEGNHSSE